MKTFLLTFLLTATICAQNIDLPIIPLPQSFKFTGGATKLRNNLVIQSSNKDYNFSAEQIQIALKDAGIKSTISTKKGDIVLEEIKPDVKAEFLQEAYQLIIEGNKIKIGAATPKGIFYGAQSLIQLIEKNNKELKNVNILDYPDMPVRGISDDISRGQVSTLENFKKIIDNLARYKMNTFMPYFEDMIVFDSYPSIGKDRGALTKDEIKELISYASDRYVEVIPIFQTLGHYENILTTDEFVKYAEFPGAASLNVSSEDTYVFLEDMLKEVFELFPSKFFHMGADESYDVGLGASKHLVEASDIATVHANHYKRVYDICKKYGKEVIMYGDIILDHPAILEKIPKDITIVDWQYGARTYYPSTEKFRDAGFNYYVSPSVWNYVTTFPNNINALPNIKYIIESGLKNGAKGMINSNWGDHGGETFREFLYFGYSWSAQCSWNYKGSNLAEFYTVFPWDFFGVNDSRLGDLYKEFSTEFNQMLWHEVFRHPALPFRPHAWWQARLTPATKISWMEGTMPIVAKNISALKSSVKKNKDQIELFEFLVKLNKWYSLKLETTQLLLDLQKPNTNVAATASDNGKVITMIDKNLVSISNLKDEFKSLWLKYNKADNLNKIEDKFDRLSSYFRDVRGLVAENKVSSFNPVLESNYIYIPEIDTLLARKAEFRTSFDLDKVPESAMLQLLGDTYVKLYVNDQLVEKVYGRNSLSLTVHYTMVKIVDIKSYLKEGENEIRVEAETYERNKALGAGVNIFGILKSGDNVTKIMTTADPNIQKWEGSVFGEDDWKPVITKEYRFLWTAPNFDINRTSWIER